MNERQEQILLDCWKLTSGLTSIYGNAIGIAGGKDHDDAMKLVIWEYLGCNLDKGLYWITKKGVEHLRTNGLIE